MAKKIWIWERLDGQRPCAIEVGSAARGPGRVFEIEARSSHEARATLARFLAEEPDEETDGPEWLEWRRARKLVREVTGE